MKNIFTFFVLFSLFLTSCKNQDLGLARVEGNQLHIDRSIPSNDSIEAFIAPYRERIAQEMDSVLAYAPKDLDKTEGDLNTAIGNMMADAVMEMANPIFEKRTGKTIDIVLLNHGGIRSTISKGEITTRTAYQVMPFENEVVVVEMKGEHLREMIEYLIEARRAHPISGMQLWINKDNKILRATVQGEPIKDDEFYYVATNDYLYQGGDNMNFLAKATDVVDIDYKIRNLLIDYFKKHDTIAPEIDERFIRK